MFESIGRAVSAVGEGIGKVASSAGREVERAVNENIEHIEEDFDSIATAIDNGGLVGGAIQVADVFSPGHQLANGLDAWNVIPEDPALKELVSAGGNVLTGGPWALMALKDIADSMGAIRANNPGASMAPQLGADHPTSVSHAPHGYGNADDVTFGDHITDFRPGNHGGMCGAGYDGPHNSLADKLQEALERLRQNLTGKRDGTGRADGELDREIAKILANPNLMFEDMIFLLMRAFIKGTRKEVTALTDDLRGTRELDQAERKKLQGNLETARNKLAAAEAKNDPAAVREASNEVQSIKERMDADSSDRAESRADKFEELKQVMQRLSEMEQALSNVLNTMHEGSMAAIRNIR